MNPTTDGSRFYTPPAIHVFIQDLQQGQWIEEEKVVSTRYGRIKRCRIFGVVTIRKEPAPENQEESFLDESFTQNARISFQIDDGTGRIWVTIFGIEIKDYNFLQKGILVEVVGKPRFYRNNISLVGEFARKIEDPNWETHHILKVLHRRKFKPRLEIEKVESTSFTEFNFDSKEFPDMKENVKKFESLPSTDSTENQMIEEISHDIENLSDEIEDLSSNDPFHSLTIMDEIVKFIQKNDEGDGVAVSAIQEAFHLDLTALKGYLEQLSQDIRIYKTNVGYYSAY